MILIIYFIAGIGGIYALSQDAVKVDFQDYVSFQIKTVKIWINLIIIFRMRMFSRPLQFPIQFYGARRMRSQMHLILAPSTQVTGSALKISHQIRKNMT